FTRDTREAYRFFTRHLDPDALKGLPWHKRAIAHARAVFMAFTMKLSPARRVVFGSALVLALIGLINLFRGIGLIEVAAFPIVGGVGIPGPIFRQGTWSLLFAFLLMNLLVLLEVADRLSLRTISRSPATSSRRCCRAACTTRRALKRSDSAGPRT